MFKEKIAQLSESDIRYISNLIQKLDNEYKDHLLATQDTLYRIATNAELVSYQELNSEGALTPQQTRKTWAFIRYFKGRNQKTLLRLICQIINSYYILCLP